MERRGSAFNGFAIEASDGFVGRITDLLFEDKTWMVRWFVVEINTWQTFRQILLHPSALSRPDNLGRAFSTDMTKQQTSASPSIESDEPVSRQMEPEVTDSYNYGPSWGTGSSGEAALDAPANGWLNNNGLITHAAKGDADPHLRSINSVRGYHIQAIDGEVGHVKDFLMDDESWQIDSLLINTKNWWRGKNVLLPTAAISEINWAGEYVRVDQTRYRIRTCKSWTETDWSS